MKAETLVKGMPGELPTANEDSQVGTPVGFIAVPKIKAKLSAGNGAFVYDERPVGYYHFRSDWLFRVCQPNEALLFDVDGKSMEPTIKDKDTVLIDKGSVDMADDCVFAIGVDDSIRVKRLRLKMNGKVEVVSDNLDKTNYPNEEVERDSLRILGQVKWRGGMV